MTTANKVTIFRILLVPAFVVQLLYYYESGNPRDRILALIFFAVAAILDGVDGYIARRYNQKSQLGTVLDPLADKMLLLSGICLLSLIKADWSDRMPAWIPTWVTAVVLSKDAILLVGMAVVYYTCGRVKIVPRLTGKVATALQFILVVLVLLQWQPVVWHLSLLTAILTGISGVQYIRDGVKQLSQSPLSFPDHRL
ncbi:MAG: CDP-alcohol phosphatidyltransferase family protein [Verrucomicrobiae bacterium]|nr:CDP-alcohol phosphatidyltransferase family protein [Verrucomicrobiae bacterium]